MNKRGITQAKAYFLMINLVIAIVAFSWMVGGEITIDKKDPRISNFNYDVVSDSSLTNDDIDFILQERSKKILSKNARTPATISIPTEINAVNSISGKDIVGSATLLEKLFKINIKVEETSAGIEKTSSELQNALDDSNTPSETYEFWGDSLDSNLKEIKATKGEINNFVQNYLDEDPSLSRDSLDKLRVDFEDTFNAQEDVLQDLQQAAKVAESGNTPKAEKIVQEVNENEKRLQEKVEALQKKISELTGEQVLKSLKPGMNGIISADGIGEITLVENNGKLGYIKDNSFNRLNDKQLKTFKPKPIAEVPPGSKLGELITMENFVSVASMGLLGMAVGTFAGGKDGAKWGFVSGAVGTTAKIIAEKFLYKKGVGMLGQKWLTPGIFGIGVGLAIFALTYKKESQEIVEFDCLPYQPPIGGSDCELCNDKFGECSEYRCKSLGQACELLNAGTEDEKCAWVNPHDVNSPMIKIESVLEGYKWVPDTAVRPPATGVVIIQTDGNCVEAFTPLEFDVLTDEPAQCRIDYNLTKGFDEMSYYIGGSNLFSYNHTETMSLPGPEAINDIAPELKNDGTYTLYVRCQDANGNFNQDAFSVRFCVNPGPDTTPPKIESVNIPSNSPINYNKTELDLEVYVNEPSECKWSRTDTSFENMENIMVCNTNLWEMNNQNVYTCKTTLVGIQNRQDNLYYFKCKDKPGYDESERNVNTQSYLYKLIGTQPLNILSVEPNETIRGSTDTIPVYLTIKTDNGYNNGESFCSYSTTGEEEDYLEFLDTGGNSHEQRQDLGSGDYTYYFKCVDLGGNAAYDSTSFSVEIDRSSPIIVRAYKESGVLKIITNEESECSYSNKDCNFEIDKGIQMTSLDDSSHTAEWKTSENYYIRCKDEYMNMTISQV